MSESDRIEMSMQICKRFFSGFEIRKARFFHLYIAMEDAGEVHTSFIFDELWKNHLLAKTAAPRINTEKNELEHLPVDRDTRFVSNKWGVSEPGGNDLVSEDTFDYVIVTLLCFDDRGHRVGYGKGYYDRFLAKCRPDCRKIGVSYFEPIGEISDIHEQDVKLDFCITPQQIFDFTS